MTSLNAQQAGLHGALRSLQQRWFLFAMICALFVIGGALLLTRAWGAVYAWRWAILPSLAIVYLLAVLWRNLTANHRPGETQLLPSLGWGNLLTLLRGVLVAGMLGFLFLPQPPGILAWTPGIFYVLSNAADFSDGLVARLTRHVTRLGEILDMSFDGLGVMAAALLAVRYGQVPAWYIAIAFARPAFLLGLFLRQKMGMVNYELPPSVSRRVFAGFQMGFLGVILLPLFTPPGTHIAALLFGLPVLMGFLVDWLAVSGVIRQTPGIKEGRPTWMLQWLPPGARLVILALTGASFFPGISSLSSAGAWAPALGALQFLAALLVVAGVLPRVAAVIGLCLIGLSQLFASLSGIQIGLIIAYTFILYAGSGAYSTWAPEERLIHHRAGEQQIIEYSE